MTKSGHDHSLTVGLALAAVLWFLMFSPWTAERVPFWLTMAVASFLLLVVARPLQQIVGWLHTPATYKVAMLLLGVAIAAALWLVFWMGDTLSAAWFPFARPQVQSVYTLRDEAPAWLVALQLLLLTGPAEELFWRGYVQRTLALRSNANRAFLLTTALYTLIHIWSFNLMLIMAAAVCGTMWGWLYRTRPGWLPALVLSHALWDAAVFVFFPFA